MTDLTPELRQRLEDLRHGRNCECGRCWGRAEHSGALLPDIDKALAHCQAMERNLDRKKRIRERKRARLKWFE